MKHNARYISEWKSVATRYRHEKWYLTLALVFLLSGILLYMTRPTLISPCPEDGCFVKTVYATVEKSELQQITDYIVQVFQKYGRQTAVKALSCFISESGLRSDVVSPTNDHGVAQINLTYHKLENPYDYKANIDMAEKIFVSRGKNFSAWYGKYCQ